MEFFGDVLFPRLATADGLGLRLVQEVFADLKYLSVMGEDKLRDRATPSSDQRPCPGFLVSVRTVLQFGVGPLMRSGSALTIASGSRPGGSGSFTCS